MSEQSSEHGDGEEMAATHWEFDVDQEDPAIDVVAVVAELEGKDGIDLPPIYNTIDHLIEKLFSEPPAAESQAVIQFSYEGYRINLNQDGQATFMKIAGGE
ncbi:HalOD1 output domain-containing protein [Natronorubrum sp. DTA7]|uniref:HalOD1 output domain-containing protein n=1 Tax=Natronorubrum sp. DTA7 TaxID=3447016 RepID=UPI003F87D0BB